MLRLGYDRFLRTPFIVHQNIRSKEGPNGKMRFDKKELCQFMGRSTGLLPHSVLKYL
jgi:hypothetical protein